MDNNIVLPKTNSLLKLFFVWFMLLATKKNKSNFFVGYFFDLLFFLSEKFVIQYFLLAEKLVLPPKKVVKAFCWPHSLFATKVVVKSQFGQENIGKYNKKLFNLGQKNIGNK